MEKIIKFVFFIILSFFVIINVSYANTSKPHSNIEKESYNLEEKIKIDSNYSKIPLYFIKNNGQLSDKVEFYSKGIGNGIFFTKEGIYFTSTSLSIDKTKDLKTRSDIIKLTPLNANKNILIVPEERQETKVNYFIGNNPKEWIKDIPTFGKIRYQELYDGIDVVFYGNQSQLEYDIVVKPGAELSKVAFEYEGIEELSTNEDNDLIALLKSRDFLIFKKPIIYQEIEGKVVKLNGNYNVLKKDDKHIISFNIEDYDKQYPLIIDPIVVYSTYLGGSGDDGRIDITKILKSVSIAVDNAGNVYLTGYTDSTDFPKINPIYDKKSGIDVFVTKINSVGNSVVYSTYIGGSYDDKAHGIAVDSSGNVYITGETTSDDFPTTQNAIQKDKIDIGNVILNDAFITKINSYGNSIIYSTYLGGTKEDIGRAIAVDSSGNIYVTGETTSYKSDRFPLFNPYQDDKKGFTNVKDTFISKINSSGSAFIYSTYLGSSLEDTVNSIAVDNSGNAFITGKACGSDFPLKNPYQDTIKDECDAYVTKIKSDGSDLIYSTLLGGNKSDEGSSITIDAYGNAYITGYTYSNNFPVKNNIFSYKDIGYYSDVFITKINPSGTDLIFSTYLGGTNTDRGYSIDVDAKGNVYVVGTTLSNNFYTRNPIQSSKSGVVDSFLTKISPSGTEVIYSTYLGGSNYEIAESVDIDSSGNVYVAGVTNSSNFLVLNQIYNYKGKTDVFIFKVQKQHNLAITKSDNGLGTVSSNPLGINCGQDCSEEYDANTLVNITAVPDEGYVFRGWGGDCSGCGLNPICGVLMNQDKNCTATFKVTHTLTINKVGTGQGDVVDGTNCTINWNGNTGTCVAYEGASVTLLATPASNSNFSGWSDGTGSASVCSGTGSCSFNLNQDSSLNATFVLKEYAVTVNANGNGSGVISSDPAGINLSYPLSNSSNKEFIHGTTVVLTAMANTGSTVSWLCEGGSASGNGTQIATCTFSNISSAKTAIATFTISVYSLNVSINPAGAGSVIGTGISCPTDCTESFNFGASIELTAVASEGYVFNNWSGSINSSSQNIEFVMDGDKTITAYFTPIGCIPSSLNISIDLPLEGFLVTKGEQVLIRVFVKDNCNNNVTGSNVVVTFSNSDSNLILYDDGQHNDGSAGDGVYANVWIPNYVGNCIITIYAEKTGLSTNTDSVSGMVQEPAPVLYNLTISKKGSGSGIITATDLLCEDNTCEGTYTSGTNVELTASPEVGSTFVGWSGDCSSCGNNTACQIVIDSNKVCEATFALAFYSLNVSVNPWSSGKVYAQGVSCPEDCTESYVFGSSVSLTAVPNDGYIFSNWSGSIESSSNPLTITMDSNKTVVANFAPVTYQKITVISPNGGEIIPTGSVYKIEWGAPSEAVYFDLMYSINNGKKWITIAKGITLKSYNWLVPRLTSNQTNCLIRVIGYNNLKKKVGEDRSDSTFSIEVVRLISPNGGEIISSGDIFTISWIFNDTLSPVGKIELYYSEDNGKKWYKITTIYGSLNSYDWEVPNVGEDISICKAKVVLKSTKGKKLGEDISDGNFTITSSL